MQHPFASHMKSPESGSQVPDSGDSKSRDGTESHQQKIKDASVHMEELERIHTFERVGTHAQYYEKGGLRTEGDGVDHDGSHHKLTPRLFFALLAMSFLWIGSQIPLYLFGGVTPDIYSDIGGYDRWVWFVIGYLIPVAAVCPFVGALSDLFGRKYVAFVGQICLIIGPVVTSTAHNMNIAIGGQVISGIGAGLNELTSLSGTAEMVPTSKRSLYIGAIVFTLIPFAPSVLYAQLITGASSWRWVGAFVAGWNFVGLVLLAVFYKPPPRTNSMGYSRKEILKRIDYIGGTLSVGGVLCFMMGCQWGAQQYAWSNAHIIAPLVIGILLISGFFAWEIAFARYPMVPHRIFSRAKRTMTVTLLITFLSGGNFFVMLLFWPPEVYNVYGNNRIGIGLRTLPIGFGILGGAVISLVLIAVLKGNVRLIMIVFTAVMTAGSGAVSLARPDNLNITYIPVTLASIGVGGVIVPCSIIAQIVCPDDLIATITAITLSIRYIGGAIGFTVYYNVFYKDVFKRMTSVGINTVVFKLHYLQGFEQHPINESYVLNLVEAIAEAKYSLFEKLCKDALYWPTVASQHYTYEYFYNTIADAVHYEFSQAYRWPYWISIAFGGTAFIASFFLGDLKPFLDDHVAVVI